MVGGGERATVAVVGWWPMVSVYVFRVMAIFNLGSRSPREDPTYMCPLALPYFVTRHPSLSPLVGQKNVPECPSPRTGRQQDLGQTKKQTKKIIVGQDEKVSPY